MQKFFSSRSAQVIAGALPAFILGVLLHSTVVTAMTPKLYNTLTGGVGLFVLIVMCVVTVFVGIVLYVRMTRSWSNNPGQQR